jgi:nucleotide-binding universal stress UspA family protein
VDVDRAAAGPFDAGGAPEEFVERLERRTASAVESFADLALDTAPVTLEEAGVRGTTPTAIHEYAVEQEVDLPVVATRGETTLSGHLLGSVTDRVLRLVDVPVLVVPA